MVTLPLAYERPLEKVVVATKVGTPLTSASTWPFVPAEVVARAPDPFPRRMVFAWMFDCPVPPFETPRIPEMSVVRETREVETAPAVALSMPERFEREREPKKAEVLDA